jgi:hypothetical protein
MTSQGHAITRFERALATGNLDVAIPAALELPRPILLCHAIRVLLLTRERAPERYPSSAARFAARLVAERRLSLADAQLAYAALQGLAGERPAAAGAALEALLEEHGEHATATYLGEWLRARE